MRRLFASFAAALLVLTILVGTCFAGTSSRDAGSGPARTTSVMR